MTTQQPYLSLIIPVYNESDRIENLPAIAQYLTQLPITHELIVVDDGSTDSTLSYLQKLAETLPFTLITYPDNQGKGHAIKIGILQARGHWRGFMDIDISVPIATIATVLNEIRQAPIIIGTRRHTEAHITKAQPKLRERMGSIFTLLAQLSLGVPATDFTCGFKFFRQDAAESIFSKMQIKRWSFDPELLFIAHRQGWKVHELPVVWHNDDRTKVKFPQDALRSFHDLFLIRYHQLTQKY